MAQMEYLNLGVQYFRLIKLTIFILALLICSVFSQATYTKYTERADPNAKCLDGSSPFVYLHQGTDRSNILFFLEGSGPCFNKTKEDSLKSCSERSLTNTYGSSKFWSSTYNFSDYGMMDYTVSGNKFANWTKIIIIGCDGGGFQGNNLSPLSSNGQSLYFRGSVNMRAHFKWADQKYNFSTIKTIVLAGYGAGGDGVMLWIDYLKGLVPSATKVYGIVGSSISMDLDTQLEFSYHSFDALYSIMYEDGKNVPELTTYAKTYDPKKQNDLLKTQLSNFYALVNAHQSLPNTKCVDSLSNKTQMWRCLNVGYARKFLQSKLLWIHSQYDPLIVSAQLKIPCLRKTRTGYTLSVCRNYQVFLIELYRSKIYHTILNELIKQGHSVWSIACSFNNPLVYNSLYYSDLLKSAKQERVSIQQACERYALQNKTINSIDVIHWPGNKQCAY